MSPRFALPTNLLALTLALSDPTGAGAQPSVPPRPEPRGDILQVRDCDAVLATFPPVVRYADAPCTNLGCSSGLHLDTRATGHAPGTYRFEIEADGQRFTCSQRLPLTSCDPDGPCQWTRSGSHHGFFVTRSGCALPPSQQGLPSVEFHGLCPAHVSVRVLRDGVEVGRYASDVRYRRLVVNGEHCGPMCAQGTGALPMSLRR